MTEKVVYELSLRDLMSKGLTDINRKLDAVENKLGSVQKKTNNTSGVFQQMGVSLGALASGAGLAALGMIGKGIFDITAKAEATQASFAVLLGSQEKATKLVGEIRRFAAATPFETGDLEQSANTLMGFGVEGNKVMGTMKMLGDVSMGNADKFQRLTLAFAQTQSAGRLMGQDLLQYVNAGFNPLKIISEQTGKSIGELKDMMSDGQISSEMVSEAFRIATSEGGSYFGMLEKQSQTLSGKMSTLVDDIKLTGLAIGQSNLGNLHKMFDLASASLKNLEPFRDLFSEMFAPLTYIGELFNNATLGASGLLTVFKSIATALQIANIPAQILTAQLFFIFDLLKAVFTFDFNNLTKAFTNYGERMASPFTTIKDIWTNEDKAIEKGNTAQGLAFGMVSPGDQYAGLKQFNAGGGEKEDVFAALMGGVPGKGGKEGKDALGKQVSEVSGGVPKVVNINIEALIKDVKNYFGSGNTAVAESKVFLDQLQTALNMIVTDVNIVSNYGH